MGKIKKLNKIIILTKLKIIIIIIKRNINDYFYYPNKIIISILKTYIHYNNVIYFYKKIISLLK